jgi:hypothetical protein
MAWLTGWNYRIKLTVANSFIDSDLSNWTLVFDEAFDSVLTSVNGPLDADGTRPMLSDGGDLRTTAADGETRIAMDLRSASTDNNPANGRLELACRISSVSSSAPTDIYLYWGKAAESQPAVGDTYGQYNAYDSSYEGVWPLKEDPDSGGAGDIEDRTSNQNHGTAAASMTSADLINAKVGDGHDYDGSDDHVTMGDVLDFERTDTFSVFAIVEPDAALSAFRVFVGKQDSDATKRGWVLRNGGSGNRQALRFVLVNDTSSNNEIIVDSSSNIFSSSAWFHIGATYDGSSAASGVTLYSNGASVADTDTVDGLSATTVHAAAMGIAARIEDDAGNFDGTGDEVRVSSTVRAAAWVKAEYNNLFDIAGFLTFGTIEEAAGVSVLLEGGMLSGGFQTLGGGL